MPDAIFIVGYYRSGTSALSGALQRLGVKIFNEADPNEHNPLGFYEIPELIEYDVDLFNRLGVEWTDVRGLPAGWWERADIAPFLTRLDEILRRRFTAADPVWALKHPHLCRTLPIYERAARQAGHLPHVLHIFRDPWTAAASQQRKNGLSRAHALLLWLSYATGGERQARHLPRSWMTYQDLLDDPAGQLHRAERETGVALSHLAPDGMGAAAAYLDTQLDRSAALAPDGLAKPLAALVARAWNAIQSRDFAASTWDDLAAETADMVGFLTEIGASRGKVIPSFGGGPLAVSNAPARQSALRPEERSDEGAKRRLEALRAAAGGLPSLAVVIVAPRGRAPAVNDTLEALRAQWQPAESITLIAADELLIPGHELISIPAEPGAASRRLCLELNRLAAAHDYVAVINAGDKIAPDGVMRFALAAGAEPPDMIYCDEIVPREGGGWVRHKPGWDVTRLRQSAYLGDWVWYRGQTVLALGGFDPARAGAEEFDLQLRMAEAGAAVTRLSEALFSRSLASQRDSIPAEVFCARAAEAIAGHLARLNMPAQVQNRQHLGLFHHLRLAPDPGTSLILLCSGAEIGDLDHWLTLLLSKSGLTGPVILAGGALREPVSRYLTSVTQHTAALEGKVLAVPPGLGEAPALAAALALVTTEYAGILDARARTSEQHWAEGLRARLADPGVAMAGARALVALGQDSRQFTVQGPIVPGADTRLGAGHMSDDPGPGGWLAVDQEASAVAPGAVLARSELLRACQFPALEGDALWIDLCAQLRASGQRLVWTPDISFTVPAESIRADDALGFRQGTPAAAALLWADPHHHPALSLHGNLLAEEHRLGLVRSAPADPHSLLVSGAPERAGAVLNAARALRRAGLMEADWSPEPIAAADLGRRHPALWVRVNPERPALPCSPPYAAMFSARPAPEAQAAITGAAACFATSPELAARVRKLARPGQSVTLWRPALSPQIWRDLKIGAGMNTRPRVLWVDEGIAPDWFADLINETQNIAAWIVVERQDATYSGTVARIRPPESETAWAGALAELGPQLLLRPADATAEADHYPALLAAAAGCHLLADDRLDLPPSLGALRLANKFPAWERALQDAVRDLAGTLRLGAAARAAALALPGLEEEPPPWARLAAPHGQLQSAAE